MQFVALIFAFCAMLAGRVYAQSEAGRFNISFPIKGQANITASELLLFNDDDLTNNCQSNCTAAITTISKCGDFNSTCLCTPELVANITACEQCAFTRLIAQNRAMPDPRAGSSGALAAFLTSCNNTNLTGVLTVPDNWDGPYGQFLNTGATVFGVILSIVLGVGAISVVNTM